MRRGLLQIEVRESRENQYCTTYLNTKRKQDQFVSAVKSYESSEPNMNSAIETAANVI